MEEELVIRLEHLRLPPFFFLVWIRVAQNL